VTVVVFRDFKKLVAAQQQENTHKELFQQLQDKPFWVWDKEEHMQEDIRTDGVCCFNHIIGLPQKDGIDKPMYDYEKILNRVKASPSFEREYNLKYLGKIGNVFHTKDIEPSIEKGRKYDPDNFNAYYSLTSRSMGIDPAYGSSAFGIVVTEWADGIVQIIGICTSKRNDFSKCFSHNYLYKLPIQQ
jgi:hypothetical protein